MGLLREYLLLSVVMVGWTATSMQGIAMGMEGLVINEFNVQGASQYVELYDGGVGGTSLDGLVLVLFSGASETIYSQPLVLDGYETDEKGYFLVSFGPALPNANVISSTVLITDGLNAIVVYEVSRGNLQVGSMVTDVGLVDAVVYGSSASPQDSRLVSILSAGQYPLQKDASSPGDQATSLSRCRGWKQIMHSSFHTVRQTPGADNACTLPSFVLNEINPRSEAPGRQFIEIFDGGEGYKSLDGVVLVVYSGPAPNDDIIISVDLTGYTTDENGFLVVAGNWTDFADVGIPSFQSYNTEILPDNNPTGVALHLGPPQKFAVTAPISNHNLIDAAVYVNRKEPDLPLISWLTPGQDTHVDAPSTDGRDYSISRCYCCSPRNSSAFGRAPISPGSINRECSIANHTVIETPVSSPLRINEVHISTSGSNVDFIEIYHGGSGSLSIVGKVLVVYAGSEGGGRSYKIVDLSNYATNNDGYFLISSSSVGLTVDDDWLRTGLDSQEVAGAAALYEGSAASFRVGDQPTTVGLIDAVVFGNLSTMTSSLLSALLPGQTLTHDFLVDTGSSALRCYSHAPLDQVSFAPGPPSPAAPNSCPKPPVVINEVNMLLTSSTGAWVELSSLGVPYFPLENLVAVMSAGLLKGYFTASKGLRTNKDGFLSANLDFIPSTGFSDPVAIALYSAPDAIDLIGEGNVPRLTDVGLINAVVIAQDDSPANQTLLDVLTPGRPSVQEREAFSHRDESLSRCFINGNWSFVPAHVSRDAPNHCPTRANPDVLINEINLATDHQFIELFDLGAGYTILDEFFIVLYGGNAVAMEVIPLSGYATDASGYFVLGVQSAENVGRVNYPFAAGVMDQRAGAVALHRSSRGRPAVTLGDRPTTQGLVDAVVYADNEWSIDAELQMLVSDERSQTLLSDSVRFSRCFSGNLRSSRAFGSRPTTIAAMNDCPVFDDDVIINELNFGEPEKTPVAFVELYDGGRGNTALTYLSLVMYSSQDKGAYLAVDLSGYSTNEDGYFVVGYTDSADIVVALERLWGNRFLETGAGAAALYRSHPGVFYHGALATKRSLIDAIVYTTDVEEETTLLEDLLPPGNFMFYEDESHEEDDGFDESVSRCFDDSRLTQSAYKLTPPTPRERNACGSTGPVLHGGDIFISEVNVKSIGGQGFVELYDGGVGDTLLNGYVLVFFDGNNRDRSSYEIDLSTKRTGSSGYFVIGGTAVTPTPDVIANGMSIPPGPGAVALYQDSVEFFPRGTVATEHYLVDVVVYGDPQDRADGLIDKLVPGQIQAYENSDFMRGADVSLSRCISRSTLTLAAFISSLKTPGSPNQCDLYPVYVNEINPYGAPSDRFVELYDGGRGYTSLDALVLLLFDEGSNLPYGVVPLTGNRTNSEGYYLIQGAPGLALQFQSSGTVALSRGDYAEISTAQAPDDSALVDRQTYSSQDIEVSLDKSSSSVPGKAFSRCESCRSPGNFYLAFAPVTPGTANQCPSPDYSNQISVKLTDASYDAWKSDNSLVTELEGIIADGVNSRCRCGFSLEYLCNQQLLPGSVVYQAEMYSTDADQSELLYDIFQLFVVEEAGKINVGGKDYSVEIPQAKEDSPNKGLPVAAVVVIAVLCVVLVVAAVVAVVGIVSRKRRLTGRCDDTVKLEENGNVKFSNSDNAVTE